MLHLDPRLDVLPAAQRHLWPSLAALADQAFVLYGGTAIALRLGHRTSVDFDFFRFEPLDKAKLFSAAPFLEGQAIVQDAPETLAVIADTPFGQVKVSFFGNIRFGRIGDPAWTADSVLLIASPEDLLSTKLKTILDRAEPRDYLDIAALLRAGASLPRAIAAFKAMFGGEPATVLRALGFFDDGELGSLPDADKAFLRKARDEVGDLPAVTIAPGRLAIRRP